MSSAQSVVWDGLRGALASDGIFAEESPGVFRNTAPSELLCGDGWRDFAHLFGSVWMTTVADLDETGAPAFPRRHGTDFWAWLAVHPDERATFDHAMHVWSCSKRSSRTATSRTGQSGSICCCSRCSAAASATSANGVHSSTAPGSTSSGSGAA
jgi:hypothetical protein